MHTRRETLMMLAYAPLLAQSGAPARTGLQHAAVYRAWLENEAQLAAQKDLAIGAEAPNILYEAEGTTRSLKSHLAKGPVVINAWDTWCLPCRAEMPALKAFIEAYNGRVAVFGLTKDKNGTASQYLKENDLPLPTLLDFKNQIGRAYGLRGMPTTCLIDPRGNVAYMETTTIDFMDKESAFRQTLERILRKGG